MQNYKIGPFNISAKNEEGAKKVYEYLLNLKDDEDRRALIFMIEEGKARASFHVELPLDTKYEVYAVSGTDVKTAGSLGGGSGEKLIRSAVESIESRNRRMATLKKEQKRIRSLEGAAEQEKCIACFEELIPESSRDLLRSIVDYMCGKNLSYYCEIITQIEDGGVNISEDVWPVILSWFSQNVIDEDMKLNTRQRKGKYTLRKAFVTTVARIAADGARHSSTMNMAKKTDDFDWSQYAQD